jgi:hypothetical protein
MAKAPERGLRGRRSFVRATGTNAVSRKDSVHFQVGVEPAQRLSLSSGERAGVRASFLAEIRVY